MSWILNWLCKLIGIFKCIYCIWEMGVRVSTSVLHKVITWSINAWCISITHRIYHCVVINTAKIRMDWMITNLLKQTQCDSNWNNFNKSYKTNDHNKTYKFSCNYSVEKRFSIFFFWFLTLLILFSAPTNKIVMSMFTHLCRFIRALFRSGHTIPLTLLKYPFLSFEMIDSIFKWKHN